MILYENITEEAFGLAIKMAVEKLSRLSADEVCKRTGAELLSQGKIMIRYLNEPYYVDLKDGRISNYKNEEELPLRDRIIILHYLTEAKGSPFTGKLLTYAQMEGGRFYFPVFHKRTVEPMVRFFSEKPEMLLEASRNFGAQRERYGDISVSILPLPMVKMYLILWKGDVDVPPNGNILFDRNVTDYLCAEDIAVLTEIVVWKIIKAQS